MTDATLPQWVARVVARQTTAGPPDLEAERQLRDAYVRLTHHMTRTYPGAWFVGMQRNDESVADLAHRTLTHCTRTEKGRFPFSGRTPFACFVEEQHDGRTIRYHSIYAKLSIARELMRADYAHNLARDPVLKWRATLYADVRAILDEEATPLPGRKGGVQRWDLPSPGLRRLLPREAAVARMRGSRERDRSALVRMGLRLCGPLTTSDLTHMLEDVLGTPAAEEPPEPVVPARGADHLALRRAVADAWDALAPGDRSLLIAVVRGDAYADIIAAIPELRNKVAVSRAVSRCGRHFLHHVGRALGQTDLELPPGRRPMDLLEPLFAVLLEVIPELAGALRGDA